MNFLREPNNFRDTDKLLYLLLQEVQGLRQDIAPLLAEKQPVCSIAKGTEAKVITCKKCGEQFDNRGKFFKHMKDHKKEV